MPEMQMMMKYRLLVSAVGKSYTNVLCTISNITAQTAVMIYLRNRAGKLLLAAPENKNHNSTHPIAATRYMLPVLKDGTNVQMITYNANSFVGLLNMLISASALVVLREFCLDHHLDIIKALVFK